MFASPAAKSTRGFTCCQVFVSDKGYVAVYSMKTQHDFESAYHWFCKQVGVPVSLIVDAHKVQTSSKTKRFCDQIGITLRILEKETQFEAHIDAQISLTHTDILHDDNHQTNYFNDFGQALSL